MLTQYGEGVFNPFAQAERTHFPILREGVGNTLLHIVVGEHQQRDKVVVRPLLILIVARRLSYAAPMDIVSVNDLAASVRQARPIPSHRVGQSDRPPVFLMHQPQTALMRGKCEIAGTDPNEQRNRRGAGAAMLSQYGEGVFNPFAQAERTHFPILREGVGNTLLHIVVGEHQQRDKVVVRPLLILIVARRLSYAAPMDIVSVNDLAASVRQARPIPCHRVGQSLS